jgi:hypothetical protein
MLFVMLGWTRLWQSSIDFFVNQLVNFARRSRNNHNEFIARQHVLHARSQTSAGTALKLNDVHTSIRSRRSVFGALAKCVGELLCFFPAPMAQP